MAEQPECDFSRGSRAGENERVRMCSTVIYAPSQLTITSVQSPGSAYGLGQVSRLHVRMIKPASNLQRDNVRMLADRLKGKQTRTLRESPYDPNQLSSCDARQFVNPSHMCQILTNPPPTPCATKEVRLARDVGLYL
jgi:hypothetical protein